MKNSLKLFFLVVIGFVFLVGCGTSDNIDGNDVEKESNDVNTEGVSNNNNEDVNNEEDVDTSEVDGDESVSNSNESVEIDLETMKEENIELSLEVFEAIILALEDGDNSKFYSLVDEHLEDDKINTHTDLKEASKEKFDKRIEQFLEVNEQETIRQFTAGLSEVTADNVEIGEPYDGTYSVTFDYSYTPEGFFNRAYVKFKYTKLDDGGLALDEIIVL